MSTEKVIAVGTAVASGLPRTDQYVKNYLIRLLPQVGREIVHLNMDEGCEVVESSDAIHKLLKSNYVAWNSMLKQVSIKHCHG